MIIRLSAFFTSLLMVAVLSQQVQCAPAGAPGNHRHQINLSPRTIAFVENRGQFSNTTAPYVLHAGDAQISFTPQGLAFRITTRIPSGIASDIPEQCDTPRETRIALRFRGTAGAASIEPSGKRDEVAHYYTAAHPEGITYVPLYSSLVYRNVYPKIDAQFTVTEQGLKYEFIVRPGGNPAQIALEYTGTDALSLLPDGGMNVFHEGGTLTDASPVGFYQDNQDITLPMRYLIIENSYSFAIPEYDPSRTFVIDPCIMWSSFLGGSTSDIASGVATDAAGNIIFTGFTSSNDFPIQNSPLQAKSAGTIDAFIVKTDPEGNRLWSTYYGGSGSEDWPRIAVDAGNNILIGGYTSSTDFPASSAAYQKENGGKIDAFAVKLSPNGTRVWATLFGGSFAEECGGIACDGAGAVYLTGSTFSTNLPVTPTANQTSNAGDFDCFLAKFDTDGKLLWSTYMGGWSLDYGTGLAITPSGQIALTGYTESTNFPVSENASQRSHGGGRYDAFVSVYSTNGKMLWSTYFGGNDDDQGTSIASGPDGSLYQCGHSKSADITMLGNGQNTAGGSYDATIACYDPDGKPLWKSYYGGTGSEQATSIAVDAKNNVYLCGFKIGDDFPGTQGGFRFDTPNSMDAFLIKMDQQGNRLWATAYGGPLGDLAYGIALDDKGNIIMAGETGSKGFPTSGNTMQRSLAGYEDGFIVKFLFYEPLVDAGESMASCADQGVVLEPTVTQGVPPYTYAWSPKAGLDNPKALKPRAVPDESTTYTLTVTDAYGCVGSDTVTVTVNERPTVDPGPNQDICPGTTFQLAANVTRGTEPYSFAWSPATHLSATDIANPVASPAKTTTYTVTVTDAKGCTHRDSITVRVLPPPVANAGQDKTVCLGSGVKIGGEASGGTPPYSYVWSPSTELDNPNAATPIATPEKNIRYAVTVTDAKGCSATDTMRITVLPALTISAGKHATICYGASAPVGGKPGGGKAPYTFTWQPTDGIRDPGASITEAAPLATTTYTLTVIDANGCESSSSVTIAVRDRLVIDAGENQTVCAGHGVSIGTPAQGGTPPYSYSWTPAIHLSSAKAATPTATPVKTTTYMLTVTDAAGCTATDSITVTVLDPPVPSVMKNTALCQGASITLEASVKGGRQPYAYSWNPPFGLSSASELRPVAQPTQTLTYVLTVTDANGCIAEDSVTIRVHPVPRLSAGKNISICRGATAEIGSEATGGKAPYTYVWTPANNISSNSSPIVKVRPKNTTEYTLTVTDANGCTATATYTVQVLDCPTGDAGSDTTLCLGAAIELGKQATGGMPPYSYQWIPATGLTSNTIATPIASPSSTTAYELTVTDANGCKFRDSVIVHIDAPPGVNAGNDRTICYGSMVELKVETKGGKKPFQFFWAPAEQLETSNRDVFSPHPGKTTLYSVTVRDANGCSASDSVLVTVAPPLTADAGDPATICKGASTTLTAHAEGGQPPFVYRWEPAAKTAGKTEQYTVSPVKNTQYMVTVTDAAGCEARDSVLVSVESVPIPVIAVSGADPACSGDTVRLRVTQSFASIKWSTGATTPEIAVTASGSFSVSGINERGCREESKPVSVTFYPRPAPEITIRGEKTFCEGGKAILRVAGRYSSYAWSDGSTGKSLTVTKSGSYSVTVKDRRGCTGISDPIDITVNAKPVASIQQYGDTLTANEEAPSYQWLRNKIAIKGATDRSYIPTRSGTYTLRIKNENGCSAVSSSIKIRIRKKK